jgi:hypothetical protein
MRKILRKQWSKPWNFWDGVWKRIVCRFGRIKCWAIPLTLFLSISGYPKTALRRPPSPSERQYPTPKDGRSCSCAVNVSMALSLTFLWRIRRCLALLVWHPRLQFLYIGGMNFGVYSVSTTVSKNVISRKMKSIYWARRVWCWLGQLTVIYRPAKPACSLQNLIWRLQLQRLAYGIWMLYKTIRWMRTIPLCGRMNWGICWDSMTKPIFQMWLKAWATCCIRKIDKEP